MTQDSKGWRIERRVNVSMVVQVMLLASLILGSWVNLQRQLSVLQHDVGLLLEQQKDFASRVEQLREKSISYEYRLRAMEASR